MLWVKPRKGIQKMPSAADNASGDTPKRSLPKTRAMRPSKRKENRLQAFGRGAEAQMEKPRDFRLSRQAAKVSWVMTSIHFSQPWVTLACGEKGTSGRGMT